MSNERVLGSDGKFYYPGEERTIDQKDQVAELRLRILELERENRDLKKEKEELLKKVRK